MNFFKCPLRRRIASGGEGSTNVDELHLQVSRSLIISSLHFPRLFQALMLILDVMWFIMIAHIIMSWLINFQVLNLRQPLVAQVWDGLNRLLEPIYRPIRSVIPDLGGLDLAPLVVFIGIIILQRALVNNAGFFLGY